MRRRTFLNRLAMLGCSSLVMRNALTREPLRIVYGENFPPFNWRDDRGEMHGLLIDLLTESLQVRLGIPVIHQGFPWARAQKMVQEGLADALCTVPTLERRLYTEASAEPMASSPYTLFCRRDNPQLDKLRQVKTLADLRAFRLIHYIGSSWAKLNLAGAQVSWANTPDGALAMVAARRGDAIVDASVALRWTIRQLKLQEQLIELPQVFTTESFNLLIRKSSPDVAILPRFDRVVRQMRMEGVNKQLFEKYGVAQPA